MDNKIYKLQAIPCTADQYNIPAIGCVKKTYAYGGIVGISLLYLLTRK